MAPVMIPARQIRARYTDDTITVYQAYAPEIAVPAVAAGRFVAPFKRDRMTWVKPSFLRMMYRCGWASKPGQEHVLAVEITRADLAGGDLDEEQYIDPFEEHGVDREEVAGQHGVRLGGEELLPGRSRPAWCRVHTRIA
jgi:hypothetical protein